MFDLNLDEALHALEGQRRKALMLVERVWREVYANPEGRQPSSITDRLVAELSERREEVRDLRERLNDALDSREQAELRAEKAESLVEKMRAWIARWGLAAELDIEMPCRRPEGRHEPGSPHHERPDRRDAEMLLRRQLTSTREAEHRAFRIAEHQRDRAVSSEQLIDTQQHEIGRLRSALDF